MNPLEKLIGHLDSLDGRVVTVHVQHVATPVISHRHAKAMQDALAKLERQGSGSATRRR